LAKLDPSGILAVPLETVEVYAQEQAVLDVIGVIEEEHATTVYVGYPVSDDGKPSQFARRVEQFTKLLRTELVREGIEAKIEFAEERYTTKQAHAQMHELGLKPSENRDIVDQMAAVNILEGVIRRAS
jgi:putative Holliday junction resolvase